MPHRIKGLSHAARRDRRQQIAEAVKIGKSLLTVAEEFKVGVETVRLACTENDVNWRTPSLQTVLGEKRRARQERSVRQSRIPKFGADPCKENIFAFVDFIRETGCWNWKFCAPGNYGNFRGQRAHALVYELFKGDIPKDRWVLHHCDNPSCVNPDHLYAGTELDNNRDRSYRERGNTAKLTGLQAVEIKRRLRLGGESVIPLLAKQYGVHYGTIRSIHRGQAYLHAVEAEAQEFADSQAEKKELQESVT